MIDIKRYVKQDLVDNGSSSLLMPSGNMPLLETTMTTIFHTTDMSSQDHNESA